MMTKMTAALAATVMVGAAGLAADIETAPGVAVETMDRLDLTKEEIGVAAGDFRTSRATLDRGAVTRVNNADGDVAMVYVAQGEVTLDGAELHTGQLARLEDDQTVQLANSGRSRAVILITDVIGTQR